MFRTRQLVLFPPPPPSPSPNRMTKHTNKIEKRRGALFIPPGAEIATQSNSVFNYIMFNPITFSPILFNPIQLKKTME